MGHWRTLCHVEPFRAWHHSIRSWEFDQMPGCRAGLGFPVIADSLVAYDTGERFATATALAEALTRMSVRSIFYHVREGRRRTGGRTDGFSAWLEGYEVDMGLVKR